jgi:hypothetical protein
MSERGVNLPMLPTRKYWSNYLLHLALGILSGLVVGEVVEALTVVPGWGVVGVAGGAVLGALAFMLRRDT